MGNELIVATIPFSGPVSVDTLKALRKYLQDSITCGLVVLPHGSTVRRLELAGSDESEDPAPQLPTQVEPSPEPSGQDAPDEAEDTVQPPSFTGAGAREKLEIRSRMQAYRAAHGLGCWSKLAPLVGVSTDQVRSLYMGDTTATLQFWRKIGRALDVLEGRAKEGAAKPAT